MTANPKADVIIANKMKLLNSAEMAALRKALQRLLDDPAYAEKIRLARTKPVVDAERHLRQARDLIAAIDALA